MQSLRFFQLNTYSAFVVPMPKGIQHGFEYWFDCASDFIRWLSSTLKSDCIMAKFLEKSYILPSFVSTSVLYWFGMAVPSMVVGTVILTPTLLS